MNTRLQVEHPVTEAVTGLDLVRMQLEVARGAPLSVTQASIRYDGYAIEARLYAEDEHFVPQVGRILAWEIPAGVRVDHGLRVGQRVTSDYDAMLAKIIAHAPTRTEALEKLEYALRELVVHGVTTNRSLLLGLLASDALRERKVTTTSFPPVAAAEPSRRLIAVAAALLAGRPSIGYRVHGLALDRLRFAIGEAIFSAVVSSDSVYLGENQRMVVRIGDGIADVDGITARLIVTREREQLHLTYAGETCTVRNLPLLEPRRAATVVRREVLAPMSGKVVSISAHAGEHVDAGALLLVLEAMKMQHEVRAPQASRVKHVRAAAGGQVAARSVLVELDPEEGAP
jgi:acetyl/propionyl-CoA carboxylase alpha subunit